jgi:hypothetical protein
VLQNKGRAPKGNLRNKFGIENTRCGKSVSSTINYEERNLGSRAAPKTIQEPQGRYPVKVMPKRLC